MKTLKLITLGIFSFSLFLTSCKKEDTPDTDTGTTTSENNSTSEAMFNHVFDIANAEVNHAEDEEWGTGKTNSSLTNDIELDTCATISYEIDTVGKFVKSMTIDYGSNGCTWNGRQRMGKIHITATGRFRTKGTVLTITPENLTIDGYKVEGTKSVTNNGGTLIPLSLSYDIVVQDGKVTAPDGAKNFQWNTTRTVTYKIVNSVLEVHYTGTASGINQNSIPFTISIDEALVARAGCKHFVSGILTVKPEGFKDRSVNYGDGTCDNKAVVTIGGETTKDITLK